MVAIRIYDLRFVIYDLFGVGHHAVRPRYAAMSKAGYPIPKSLNSMPRGQKFKIFVDIKKIRDSILDFILPIFCAGCGKEGEWLCKECEEVIKISSAQFCPVCKANTIGGRACNKCNSKSYLSALISAGFYHDKILRGLIASFKYHNAREVIKNLEKFIFRFFCKINLVFDRDAIIVPVPLHRRKKWARGFNQAEIIARFLNKRFDLKIDNDIIKRTINTEEQAKIKKIGKRSENIKDAFAIVNKKDAKGRSFILVDDVYTTGATMQECAKVLRESGAEKIVGFVVARG